MKEKKKEAVAKQPVPENKNSPQANKSADTPTSLTQISENFRQNAGNNIKDAETAPGGSADYR